ncbi:MAG: 3-methyl-2-oxobutanoate hydroxymethyltransferase [Bacillota bacterium]|uniref:3-methyl-2-oxobutanoate hydroxymethyltransferase n=1 Tax=Fictibacillus sp. 18YEL24 TaxID=2745875 RepID=UPI0018CD382D|nr:3-methyl-2-oxobutanoate hydroxymethyltransferase [Fictibacillus sp. 18YEL24]MBH0168383.1 3-methyl-2-oxobutanoate hydroxymethyltransferase [Fictibacillus sp. 18YEL24]
MKTTKSFLKMKRDGEKISMVTAYDYPTAVICEKAEMDLLLVGDSLGMVVLGYDSTIPVTMEDMIYHTKAVKRGAPNTFIVTDMPFMTYHGSIDETLNNARRILQESGASAVKVEGGKQIVQTVERLTDAGVPVMGHLGLTPQMVGVMGGYGVQGKEERDAERLIEESLLLEKAGAFAIVLECVPQQLAEIVTKKLRIPVIGIGAGKHTDGQVLVYHDMIGYGFHHVPKFVKTYGNVKDVMVEGLLKYKEDVRTQQFPEESHSFNMKAETLHSLYGGVQS